MTTVRKRQANISHCNSLWISARNKYLERHLLSLGEVMDTARIDFEDLKEQLSTAIEGLGTVSRAVGQITTRLHAAQGSSSVGESWVRTWGETLPKKAAAKMLGVSVTYLNKLISDGAICVTPDGRVVVRSAADWANQNVRRETSPKKKWRV